MILMIHFSGRLRDGDVVDLRLDLYDYDFGVPLG